MWFVSLLVKFGTYIYGIIEAHSEWVSAKITINIEQDIFEFMPKYAATSGRNYFIGLTLSYTITGPTVLSVKRFMQIRYRRRHVRSILSKSMENVALTDSVIFTLFDL